MNAAAACMSSPAGQQEQEKSTGPRSHDHTQGQDPALSQLAESLASLPPRVFFVLFCFKIPTHLNSLRCFFFPSLTLGRFLSFKLMIYETQKHPVDQYSHAKVKK